MSVDECEFGRVCVCNACHQNSRGAFCRPHIGTRVWGSAPCKPMPYMSAGSMILHLHLLATATCLSGLDLHTLHVVVVQCWWTGPMQWGQSTWTCQGWACSTTQPTCTSGCAHPRAVPFSGYSESSRLTCVLSSPRTAVARSSTCHILLAPSPPGDEHVTWRRHRLAAHAIPQPLLPGISKTV